jgi:hypothetical protein
VTPEAVRDNWQAITSFKDATFPETIQESVTTIMDKLTAIPASGGNSDAWTLDSVVCRTRNQSATGEIEVS